MTYRAPVDDMLLAMRVAGLDKAMAAGLYADLSDDLVRSVLEEAAKVAGDVLAPINRSGDLTGAILSDGRVMMPAGFREAYQTWMEGGWNALPGPEAFGGQGLPTLLNVACLEMWNASNMGFALGPLLTMGAIEALTMHGSEYLQRTYLAKLVSGAWMGTMNLTEPQAGSDLAGLRTRAEPAGDGTYRIFGQKIYITYGDHDLTENIVHLVLARLPDAPHGTRGISLFLVPKFLVNEDGSLGARNDVRVNGIEHKLGINASPTCTMVYGDEGGAVGWLIGEENRGLACMFTMMNNARLGVGVQGVAIADRAYQKALAYANERRQGRYQGQQGTGMAPIAKHPDVKRMLMTMKAETMAARLICYMTAAALDQAHRLTDDLSSKAAHDRASLLTPVAKAYSTDVGVEAASTGVQVHGGMGFVEETGAAQHLRDARIAPIYEGTNGIQAIDLVMRKLPLAGGDAVRAEIAAMRKVPQKVMAANDIGFGHTASRLRDAVEALDRATSFMLKAAQGNDQDQALAGATPYLRLFGIARGGTALAEAALLAQSDGASDARARIAVARFHAETIAVHAAGLEAAVMAGADPLTDAEIALAG